MLKINVVVFLFLVYQAYSSHDGVQKKNPFINGKVPFNQMDMLQILKNRQINPQNLHKFVELLKESNWKEYSKEKTSDEKIKKLFSLLADKFEIAFPKKNVPKKPTYLEIDDDNEDDDDDLNDQSVDNTVDESEVEGNLEDEDEEENQNKIENENESENEDDNDEDNDNSEEDGIDQDSENAKPKEEL